MGSDISPGRRNAGLPERRKHVRHACELVALLPAEAWSIRVQNISPGGMCLLASRAVKPGSRLSLYLCNLARNFRITLEVLVICQAEYPDRDFPYVLGCECLPPLTEAEMNQLI